MPLETCTKCHRQVIPAEGGHCPNCHSPLRRSTPGSSAVPTFAPGPPDPFPPSALPKTRDVLTAECELEDPIREVSRKLGGWCLYLFLGVSVGLVVLIAVALFAPKSPASGTLLALAFVVMGLIGFGFLLLFGFLVWWRAFAPRRATDVFYLRSFRNDAETWPIRVAIQKALGRRHRLSGIRDPQRRSVSFLEHYSPLFLAMKYCTPRYMDLEAGKDWKARLWHSLQRAELAVLDLSVLTPFVQEEIRLAAAALGIERLVCLGRAPQTLDEVRQLASAELGMAPENCPVHIIIWPAETARRPSKGEEHDFLAKFSRALQAARRAARPASAPPPPFCGEVIAIPRGRRKANLMLRRMILMQAALLGFQLASGLILGIGIRDEALRNKLLLAITLPFGLVNLWLLLQNWLVYIYDVGIWGDRMRASIGLAIAASAAIYGLFSISEVFPATAIKQESSFILPPLTQTQLEKDKQLIAEEDRQEMALLRLREIDRTPTP